MAVSRLSQSTLQNAFPKYNSAWDGVSAVGSMEAISSITLSAARANVEFNNIPQTYTHLQLRRSCQTNRSGVSSETILIRFNNDTGSNYKDHYFFGDGATVYSGSLSIGTSTAAGATSTTSATGNPFAAAIVDILDYTNTNKYKTVRALSGFDNNSSSANQQGYASITSGLWFKAGSGVTSDAITSLIMFPEIGTLISANSVFTLYGIK